MTKSEFLDALRRALNGNMAAASVDDCRLTELMSKRQT